MDTMKVIITFFFVAFYLSLIAQVNQNHVFVNPYLRSDGTKVEGHYRTAPNSTNVDNFSTIPNVNPYTGKFGTIQPDYNLNFNSQTNWNSSPVLIDSIIIKEYLRQEKSKQMIFDVLKNETYNKYPLYESKSGCYILEYPDSHSAKIIELKKGDMVRVLESTFENWWKVYVDGRSGYIQSSFVSFVSEGFHNTPSYGIFTPYDNFSRLISTDPQLIYYTKAQINLREGPSTNTVILAKISKDEGVKVVNSSLKDWWEIEYNGINGYVYSNLLYK